MDIAQQHIKERFEMVTKYKDMTESQQASRRLNARNSYHRKRGKEIPYQEIGGLKGYKFTEQQRANLKGKTEGKLNGNYQGGGKTKAWGHKRAQRIFQDLPLCMCGNPSIRHHIDENPLNNDPSNLEFICQTCHMKVHYKKGGGLYEYNQLRKLNVGNPSNKTIRKEKP